MLTNSELNEAIRTAQEFRGQETTDETVARYDHLAALRAEQLRRATAKDAAAEITAEWQNMRNAATALLVWDWTGLGSERKKAIEHLSSTLERLP